MKIGIDSRKIVYRYNTKEYCICIPKRLFFSASFALALGVLPEWLILDENGRNLP